MTGPVTVHETWGRPRQASIIRGVLDRVDLALVALIDGSGDIDGLRRVVDLMSDTLVSHLAYEERELLEPLARLPLALGGQSKRKRKPCG